jgi:nicotinamidase-related amidase
MTTSKTALILIDFINPLDFSGRDQLAGPALAAARATSRLKARANAAGRPVIYVNDNFGRWRSNFLQVIDQSRHAPEPAPRIIQLLIPQGTDYFILKPLHSGFFQTPLDALLKHLRIGHLILTGLLTDSCVLFTANDAYVREYRVSVASDCVATLSAARSRQALDYMRRTLKADVRPSRGISFSGKTNAGRVRKSMT